MTSLHALAIRRAALVGCGVGATMLAHQAAMDHLMIGRQALVVLALACLVAVLSAAVGGSFRPRGPLASFGVVLVVQAIAHLAMGWAPWVFGMHATAPEAVLGPEAAPPHLVAALVVWALVTYVERALGIAMAAVAVVRRLLAPSAAGRPALVALSLAPALPTPLAPLALAPSRGPPPLRV